MILVDPIRTPVLRGWGAELDYVEFLSRIFGGLPPRFRFHLLGLETLDPLCRIANLASDVTLAVDEIDFFYSRSEPSQFERIVKYGRNLGISWVVTLRRPSESTRSLTSQATHIVSFAIHEPIDLEWIQKLSRELADKVRSLRGHDYVVWETERAKYHVVGA